MVKLPYAVAPPPSQPSCHLRGERAIPFSYRLFQVTASLELGSQPFSNISVCVIDYGQGRPASKNPSVTIIANLILFVHRKLLSVTHGPRQSTYGPSGCLSFELIIDHHPFGQDATYATEVHLQNMVEHLGPFPRNFLEACSRQGEYFSKGMLLRDFTSSSLEEILVQLGMVDKDDSLSDIGATE
ncbi:hypothetical protein F5I97DRAFT_1669616 [Phlebopus sp. FC_14]|nr:hypothetical protein F5I97DRAFT_1669616 [Phlebopus sp. FC_14]